MISSCFDIESEWNFELKIEKLYLFRRLNIQKNACLRQSMALKQHFNALEIYLLTFNANFKIIFWGQKLFFLRMSMFCFFRNENISFLTFNFLNSKLPFVLFGGFRFYFIFDHSDVRIKQNVLFRYQNKLKIRPQKWICFMHVDITSGDKVLENGNFLSSLLSQRRDSPLHTQSRPCLEDPQRSPECVFYYKLSTDWHVVGQSSFWHLSESNKEANRQTKFSHLLARFIIMG
jgi:hypothetical protein